MKKYFNNMNELYNCSNFFWSLNMYMPHIRIIKTDKKPYLFNSNTNEKITTLKKINKYLYNHNLEFEI